MEALFNIKFRVIIKAILFFFLLTSAGLQPILSYTEKMYRRQTISDKYIKRKIIKLLTILLDRAFSILSKIGVRLIFRTLSHTSTHA